MKNTIAERVADFLKDYPPFQFLSSSSLLKISGEVQVLYYEKDKPIFKEREKNTGIFYVVKDGAVRLYRTENQEPKIVDICDEGDLFGLRPLITKEDYELSASANEETILYGIPIELFLPIALEHKEVSNFLIASFASNVQDPYSLEESGKLFTEYSVERNSEIFDLQKAKYSKNILTCTPDTLIKVAASKMSHRNVGSIIVTEENKPKGIITNKDLRDKIATGAFQISDPVTKIMTRPVRCFHKDPTIAQAQLIMLKNDISHLCITEDGTPDSDLLGLITEHDIVVSFANNPVVLMKEVKLAKRTKRLRNVRLKVSQLLKKYLSQNLPLSQILNILNEINYAITVRVIELSLKKMPVSPPCKFAWLALGSQGRKEQLLLTDQDHAIVFENVPAEDYEATQNYFIKLARHITRALHKIGYDYCPADMMASNPRWCQSLQEWKNQYDIWIKDPTPESQLLSAIFFDYSYVYGDTELVTSLSDNILDTLDQNNMFYRVMAKDAIRSPSPLGFFRQFLVEEDGEHKDFFDIKSRALMPLIDAARVLSLHHKLRNINNTAARFERLAEIETNNKEIYESCSYAFKALLKFRTKQGILHGDSGRFIELATLSKAEKLKLKRCFKPIQDIQEILTVRYQLK
ncbi:MAG: nucleotidyltransferase [Leeuwenhoekiella sp.]|nr:MAG: nucleotidyltransferase [Leeuwenhoekiella sp.]